MMCGCEVQCVRCEVQCVRCEVRCDVMRCGCEVLCVISKSMHITHLI